MHELADFIEEAAAHYGFDPKKVIAVGYFDGANIAGGVLLSRPGILRGAALLRRMLPLIPETLPNLKGAPVLAGNQDPDRAFRECARASRFPYAGLDLMFDGWLGLISVIEANST